MELIDIGYGNVINAGRIVAVVYAEAAPVKRMLAAAREKNFLVDATCGKKTKSVYVMDSGHVVLSARAIPQKDKREVL
ncbi:MAG: DUF370 domain-containing protein [Oscillospiraceae bacterium]|nr:DUF370 domain-containing protein [Oscillospiraceae bacterium]